MNVLVAGGAGYIGSHTCKELHRRGHKVVVYDNLCNGHKEAVQWGPLVEGDIKDEAKLTQTLKDHHIEAVMHFAALIEVGESQRDPMAFYDNNVNGTYHLLRAMQAVGVNYLVFSSTCATYGDSVKLPLSEDNPQSPLSVYGDTKLACEKMIQGLSRVSSLKSVALRYFNACGADADSDIGESHDPETHLIPLVLKSVYDPNFTLRIFGRDYPTPDGTCVRDYAHVTDLAVAHVKALEWSIQNKIPFEAFNLGTGHGSSILEVIKAVEKATGRSVKALDEDRRVGDPATLVADITKARTLLQWEPQHSDLLNVVSTASRWYLKNNP